MAGVDGEGRWADFSAKAQRKLVEILCAQCLPIVGRGPFGEEFVTAGGVALGDVNLATMESRRCPGLFIAGELLDVDGVTGGLISRPAGVVVGWQGRPLPRQTE